jgi:hypothetical protein
VRKTGTAGIKRQKTLTAMSGSLKYIHHLRSDSGSNGLVAKETVTASWSQAHFDFSEKTARTLPRICADNADQNKTTSTTETRRTANPCAANRREAINSCLCRTIGRLWELSKITVDLRGSKQNNIYHGDTESRRKTNLTADQLRYTDNPLFKSRPGKHCFLFDQRKSAVSFLSLRFDPQSLA